jgi:Zn-dependent protease
MWHEGRLRDVNDLPQFITQVTIWAPPLIFAIIVHEVMHGVIARMLGDETAHRAGRLTLNPIAHIDPFGTIILPAILIFAGAPVFGYAKPVPIDYRNLRNPRTGIMLVAAAGPLTNLTLAAISVVLLIIVGPHERGAMGPTVVHPIVLMLQASVIANVELGVFNLIPILPLDGGRVLVGLLPFRAARALSRFEGIGFLLLFALLYFRGFNLALGRIMGAVTNGLVMVIVRVAERL